MDYFEIHLVEHCNLRCQSCDNFSPLAEEEYLSEKSFTKDMKRMSELKQVKWMRLIGGEPLLHPNITFFLNESRKYFPNAEIRLSTNGVLLSKMPTKFWKACSKNKIVIEITYYPIDIDIETVKDTADTFEVEVISFDRVKPKTKTSHRNPINDKKNQDVNYNFRHCYQVNHCISLKDGKIYPCTCIPNVYHFNKYFNKNLEITDNDFIDIHTHSLEEIETFLKNPVPFCAYCNVKNRTCGKPWATTKYDIKEWFDE